MKPMTSPVIETNIELILKDHIFVEIDGIAKKIQEYQEQINALELRREKLIRIAEAAELLPQNLNRDDDENGHYFR